MTLVTTVHTALRDKYMTFKIHNGRTLMTKINLNTNNKITCL